MSARHSLTSTALPISAFAKKLIKLETSGRYEEGLALFGEQSASPDFLPDIEGLAEEDSAELLLRFGSLIGFYGFRHQIVGAQERSKDVLSDAMRRFERLNNVSKVTECQSYIALGYTRTGELEESKVWIEEALSQDVSNKDSSRLHAHLTKSLILLLAKDYLGNISYCLAVEDDFRRYGDAFLNGSLSTNIGLSYKNCSLFAEATRYLTLARAFHEKSHHKVYLGTVHNNLAQLNKTQRRFDAAHESVDAAIKLYRQVKDRNREGSSIDTKAQIFLAEKKLTEALSAADKSIAMLRKSDNAYFLVESQLTRSKILLLADRFTDAVLQLVDAVNIARVQNSEEAARILIRDFEAALHESKRPPDDSQAIEKDELELVLPPSLGNYSEYRGVWINSPHLESFGVKQGSLAIVVPEAVKRGDLVAITETGSDQVICGVYDSEFGIVCLERGNEDPQLFNENDIRILGKIIGVCNTGRDADGKMVVEPLNP